MVFTFCTETCIINEAMTNTKNRSITTSAIFQRAKPFPRLSETQKEMLQKIDLKILILKL